jgi:hypothetical protein
MTHINPKYLSDAEKIISKKSDNFITNYSRNNPEEKLRGDLLLNEPPNFFNPFIPNTGNNNVNYNPFYTNDRNKIIFNLNRYLIDRFIRVNFNGNNRYPYFFSKEEYVYFKRIANHQIIIALLTIPSAYLFIKKKKFNYFGICLFNCFISFYLTHKIKFITYNSYIRNFNGYTDEQIDYIITFNEKKLKENKEKI